MREFPTTPLLLLSVVGLAAIDACDGNAAPPTRRRHILEGRSTQCGHDFTEVWWGDELSKCVALMSEASFASCQRDVCEPAGGSLACIGSAEEYDAIYAAVLEPGLSGGYPDGCAFIGLHQCNSDEGGWEWTSSSCAPGYTPWADGEPNDYDGAEDCAMVCPHYAPTGYGWNDGPCHEEVACLCEADVSATQLSADELECPVGATHTAWSACYFLWVLQLGFLFFAIKRARGRLQNGSPDRSEWGTEASTIFSGQDPRRRWEKDKGVAVGIFVVCTVMHFVALTWMDFELFAILLAPCTVVGVVFPLIMCGHGDKLFTRLGGAASDRAAAPAVDVDATVAAAPVVAFVAAPPVAVVSGTVISAKPAASAAGGAPSIIAMVEKIKRELAIPADKPMVEAVDDAAVQLGINTLGMSLKSKADACYAQLA